MGDEAKRRAELLALLEAHRAETIQEIKKIVERHRTATESAESAWPTEWGDQVSQHIDDDMDAALLERKNDLLRRIDHSITRLAEGRYGDCDECGRPIGLARLRVLPFATRCTACQEKADGG